MSSPLIVFGLGSFVDLVAHHFEAEGGRRVVAQSAHRRFIPAAWAGKRTLVAFEELAARFSPAEHEIFIALEHGGQNAARAEIAVAAKASGYRLASFVSPSARIAAGVDIGEHCFIMDGVVAQYGVRFGANNILHANCFFGQGSSAGDHNYFGAGCFIDRFARIGSHNVFGSQVRVREYLEVADWNSIKAFQTVEASLAQPTLIDAALRAPGFVVDRRKRN